ncbi:MAG TPA: ergothioneine biosynthesis protein EgtB [Clostridia bacterium]|nr:ergothioneine biosynthesis protein EgtB [Clostridia bacterium]
MSTAVHGHLSPIADGLARRFIAVRTLSMRLTENLSAEDQMLQSMPDASPIKWHLAHTTWFFETFILRDHVRAYKPLDERYRYLFNSYYKQIGGHPYRGSRGLMSRPSLQQVDEYRRHVDAAVLAELETASDEVLRLVELGINHEQQHQELMVTDIKHALWSGPLLAEAANAGPRPAAIAPRLTFIDVEGGVVPVGHEGDGFAFDNEGPRHEVLLRPSQIASRPVTNAEYMEFMADDGYRRPELWLSDGWDMVCAQGWNSPLYWERIDDGWCERTRDEVRNVNAAEPVCHISYYEADAYAQWVGVRLPGARLPREEEWEVVATRTPATGTLLDVNVLHPQPAAGEGMQQLFGDVWEWTASPYVAYPGYKAAAGAIGEYNGKFMCNQLVLRGGSCATPADHIRASYRNFFPPHARWQFSGVRLAKDVE